MALHHSVASDFPAFLNSSTAWLARWFRAQDNFLIVIVPQNERLAGVGRFLGVDARGARIRRILASNLVDVAFWTGTQKCPSHLRNVPRVAACDASSDAKVSGATVRVAKLVVVDEDVRCGILPLIGVIGEIYWCDAPERDCKGKRSNAEFRERSWLHFLG